MNFGTIFRELNDPFLNEASAWTAVMLIRLPGLNGVQSSIIDPPGFLCLDLGRSPGSKMTQIQTLKPHRLRFGGSVENVPGF